MAPLATKVGDDKTAPESSDYADDIIAGKSKAEITKSASDIATTSTPTSVSNSGVLDNVIDSSHILDNAANTYATNPQEGLDVGGVNDEGEAKEEEDTDSDDDFPKFDCEPRGKAISNTKGDGKGSARPLR